MRIIILCLYCLVLSSKLIAQVPVTSKQMKNDTSLFRFAIMSDRTGGMIPGVFKKAVNKVNLMQPEFVLSVGDLIDGYTEDSTVWNAQWDEFESIVDKLEMPFYFVPGNHDISNSGLLKEWKRRLGAPYWYFIYKDVMFLALHTEDKVGGGLEKEQIEYVKNALEKNSNVRWTMVFMHRPLWAYGEKSGYQELEDLLAGRNYTLFSGHHHHYMKGMRNGMKHYVLATTGGGSYLRGAEFGEFEHITWVTMTQNGPEVAHLSLDGIYDENIVTEENKDQIQALRLGEWMQMSPLISPTANFKKEKTTITFKNPTSTPMTVFGELVPTEGIEFSPSSLNIQIKPNSIVEKEIQLINNGEKTIHELNELSPKLTLSASYEIDGETRSLPTTVRLQIESKWNLNEAKKPLTVDAELTDWDENEFFDIRNPLFIQEDWDWKGEKDGWFRFAVKKSSDKLYVVIQTFDEKSISTTTKKLIRNQDKLIVHLDLHSNSQSNETIIELAPSGYVKKPYLEFTKGKLKSIKAASKSIFQDSVYITTTEMAFSLKEIEKAQGKNWEKIRLNIGWMDHDRPENTKPSILWWRPLETDSARKKFGFFYNEVIKN
jgi:hypothetical protein